MPKRIDSSLMVVYVPAQNFIIDIIDIHSVIILKLILLQKSHWLANAHQIIKF